MKRKLIAGELQFKEWEYVHPMSYQYGYPNPKDHLFLLLLEDKSTIGEYNKSKIELYDAEKILNSKN